MIKGIITILLIWFSIFDSSAQTTPYYPISYKVFTPFIFNPAIAGSKDYTSADIVLSNYGRSNAQIVSGNLRLSKSENKYLTALSTPEFTNIGLGAYLFNESYNQTHNIGVGVSGAYHIQIDRNALSFLSIGVSAKGIINDYDSVPEGVNPAIRTIIPNLDAGIFYYSHSFRIGISANNILGAPDSPDSLGIYMVPTARQYHLQAGYKFILSDSYNILLEPSMIITSGDSLPDNLIDIFKPGLKIYVGSFCLGTYFNDFERLSFFGQFKYKKIYLGAYFELPYKSAYYKNPAIVEFALGLNISAVKTGFPRRNHW